MRAGTINSESTLSGLMYGHATRTSITVVSKFPRNTWGATHARIVDTDTLVPVQNARKRGQPWHWCTISAVLTDMTRVTIMSKNYQSTVTKCGDVSLSSSALCSIAPDTGELSYVLSLQIILPAPPAPALPAPALPAHRLSLESLSSLHSFLPPDG